MKVELSDLFLYFFHLEDMKNIDLLRTEILQKFSKVNSLEKLEEFRIEALGKKGVITKLIKGIAELSAEDRRNQGKELNQFKAEVVELINKKNNDFENQKITNQLSDKNIDVTLDPEPEKVLEGKIHPTSQTIDEITSIFSQMDFSVVEGPDIEDDFHNFSALNIPEEHPARQMHDTFYFKGDQQKRPLLRTHTSPVQVRVMKANKLPIRIIAPGRTYRCDSDITHTPMFHQIEGLVIDRSTHMGHLKSCMTKFCESFFNIKKLPLRFRPSYFPFTEPSAEVDIGCDRSKGKLKIGSGSDWMEILGCGMVHPNVLSTCGIDINKYQGFAFGLGVERMTMLKYGIYDLRTFFDSDIRWLKQYGFLPLQTPDLMNGLVI